jgi:hypothetical protein
MLQLMPACFLRLRHVKDWAARVSQFDTGDFLTRMR